MDSDLAIAAVDALGSEIAVLDVSGQIVWVNATWREARAAHTDDLVAGAAIGGNLVGLLRGMTDQRGPRLAAGIAAVARGALALSVDEWVGPDGSTRLLAARPLRPPHRGAVVTIDDTGHGRLGATPRPDAPGDLAEPIASLSPREREVLRLMTQGLDNRQIASELGVAYTTIRSHTRSIIDKLGARSRLDAVTRAYRAGLGDAR